MRRVPRRRPGKYAKLVSYLTGRDEDEFELSLAEVEAVLGVPLPTAVTRTSWWVPGGRRPRAHWTALAQAGYQAALLEPKALVRFQRTPAAVRAREGLGKYVIRSDGSRRVRYTAIDPGEHADRCTCGRAECPRNRLHGFRDHVAELHGAIRDCVSEGFPYADPSPWEGVLYPLMMAASITDVEADTGFVEDPMVFALCEAAGEFELGRSEMASKYLAAASIFNFLWAAYEAAVAASAPDELRRLAREGRSGERGRRLLEGRPGISSHFPGCADLVHLAVHWCRLGGRFDERLGRIEARFASSDLVKAAELGREFRNFLFHGEDEVPDHPEWGDARVAHARLARFYSVGRLLLYLIQAMAWIAASPVAGAGRRTRSDQGERQDIRGLLTNLQFVET